MYELLGNVSTSSALFASEEEEERREKREERREKRGLGFAFFFLGLV